MAPAVGLEPTTKRLTAARSTTELRRSEGRRSASRRRRRRGPARRATGYQTSFAVSDPGYPRAMSPRSPLISADELRDRILADDTTLRIVDCRWYLGKPGAGHEAYRAGHLPGAIHLDLDDDLSDP